MMACPYVAPERRTGTGAAEVAGLMSFAPWTLAEMNALAEALKAQDPNSTAPTDWSIIASKVRGRTAEECAAQVAMMPYSYYTIEMTAAQLKDPETQVSHGELSSGASLLKDMAMSAHPNLRKLSRAVKAVGNENARKILRRECCDFPGDALQAAGILAMEKIGSNLSNVKEMRKKHILECMDRMVVVLKQSVGMKKALIEEASVEGREEGGPSESELSSDENGWLSGADEAAFPDLG
jgi:hypothetical protein